jgi:peptidoglycan-N-acetylglucosamine deacetylase
MVRAVIRYVFASHSPAFARSLGVPLTLPASTAGPPAIALTFDDGPHPEGTPAILEVLANHGACATFFVVGEQVERRPELVRRILDEGHGVALHGYRHRLQLRLTRPQIEDDIARGSAAIEDATGVAPTFHRPPYGIYSRVGLELVRDRQMQPLLWSLWGKDWRKFTTPERIARRAVAGPRAGDVMLLHDADFYSSRRSHERTAAALPEIITTLRSAGLATVRAA